MHHSLANQHGYVKPGAGQKRKFLWDQAMSLLEPRTAGVRASRERGDCSGVGRECQYLVDQYAGFVFSLAERKNETKKKEKNRCDQPHVVSDIPIAAAEILLLLFEHAAQSRSCERAAADHQLAQPHVFAAHT